MTNLSKSPEPGNPFLPVYGRPDHYVSTIDGTIRDSDGNPVSITLVRAAARTYFRCRFGLVHRAVMEAVLNRPLLKHEQVQHLNGNSLDNSLRNLRVGTAKDNALDKIETNTNGTKLRNQDVREIRMLAGRMATKDIAARYRITAGHVRKIVTGSRWANLP